MALPDLNILNKALKHMTPDACLQTIAQEVRRNDALRLLDMFKRNPAPPKRVAVTGPKGTLELQVPNGCTCDEVSRCHLLMIESVII